MRPRRDLGNDAAVSRVDRNLRCGLMMDQPDTLPDLKNRDGCLVAAGFDSQDAQAFHARKLAENSEIVYAIRIKRKARLQSK
jgi:hypothetical protein